MNFSLYIAKRYLLSKKSHNIINIISGISVTGVTVGTLALIVVLSVFNGFEDLVKSLYNTFNPELQITVLEGKTFDSKKIPKEKIIKIPGIINYTEVVEENALLKYKSEQTIVTLKGVGDSYLYNNPLDTMLVDGRLILKHNNFNYAIMGYLVAYQLGIKLNDYTTPLSVYIPKRTKKNLSNFDQSFNTGILTPSAVFSVQQEIDSKYIIVPIDFAKDLLEYTDEITSIEIRTNSNYEIEDIQDRLIRVVGPDFIVKNRFQQQELLYRIMQSEKWAIFFILTFILIIATFNVIGSLSMLILDKKKDIAILFSLGANTKLIKRIFFTEGLLISLSGAFIGLILGYMLCFLQLEFGLVKLGNDANAFIIPHYPVSMQLIDFLAVFFTVFIIGCISAWYPVHRISSNYLHQRVSEFTKSQ